jgi:hypothetical protein
MGAACAVDADEVMAKLREEAEERMKAGGEARQQGREKIPYPETEPGKTVDQAAALFGTNGRYVQDAQKLRATNFC